MGVKALISRIVSAALLIALTTVSAADPIGIVVDPTSKGSSVESTIIDSNCLQPCYVSTEISQDLDSIWAVLDLGGTWKFDFFDITVGGLGAAVASIDARLAFVQPDMFVASNGGLGFFTFLGWISGNVLVWDQPELVYLTDGSALDIAFEEIAHIGFGDTTTVSATVSRYRVLEPSSLALLACGLLSLGFVRFRSRRVPRTSFNLA